MTTDAATRTRPSAPERGADGRPAAQAVVQRARPLTSQARRWVTLLALFDVLVLATLAAADVAARPRAIVAFAALFTVPGWAIVTRTRLVRRADAFVVAAAAITLSLTIETTASLVMIWSGRWHPGSVAAATFAVAAALLVDDLRTTEGVQARMWVTALQSRWRGRPDRSAIVANASRRLQAAEPAAFVIPAALAVWVVGVRDLDVSSIDDYGLPPLLPLSWYLALGLLVAGAAAALAAERVRALVVASYAAAIAAVLYGTMPLVVGAPQYAWTYKHIGVTRFFEVHGHVNLQLDIYNHWPGFFSAAALASRVAGMPNPVEYAPWAELAFSLTGALLVAAAARTFVPSARAAGFAAVMFLLTNWVGQSYFAPQALAFTMALGLFVLLLHGRRPGGGPLTRVLASAAARVTRTAQAPDVRPTAVRLSPALIAAVVVIDATLVPTHELTPYIVLLGAGALVALDVIRPRWILLPMAALTFAYLGWNAGYLQRRFDLFTGLNPLANTKLSTGYGGSPQPGVHFTGHLDLALTLLTWLGAAAASIRLARLGLFRGALPLIALAASPVVVVFGQSYGGEAVFRVTFFTLPWCAALIGWAVSTVSAPRMRPLLTAAALATTAGLFVPAFLGSAAINLIRKGEVQASDRLYARAPAGALIMPAAPNFPTQYGPRYDVFAGEEGDRPNLLRLEEFRHRPLGARDIPAVVAQMRRYSDRAFLVFSTSQETYARIFQLTPPGALHSLERAVALSPRFRLWYGNEDARVYELLPNRARPSA